MGTVRILKNNGEQLHLNLISIAAVLASWERGDGPRANPELVERQQGPIGARFA